MITTLRLPRPSLTADLRGVGNLAAQVERPDRQVNTVRHLHLAIRFDFLLLCPIHQVMGGILLPERKRDDAIRLDQFARFVDGDDMR